VRSWRVASVIVAAAVGSTAPADLPFAFTTRQPIVQVRVNGGEPVPFVVDTGASIHLIDGDLVSRLQGVQVVTPPGGRQISGGGQGSVAVQTVDGLTLTVGNVSWTNQRATVVPLGYPKTKHYAGLIGAPVLMRYVPQFDFAKQVLRLIEPADYRPSQGATLIPFELQENLPVVRVTIDAGSGPLEARLTVDTGASQFIHLSRPFVDAHKLIDVMTDAKAANVPAAIGTPAPFLYGTGKQVMFGGKTFDRPRIGLSRAESGSSTRPDRDGIIGNDLLQHFRMTIDYGRKMLALEPR
jgi:hypothetical protein